MIVLPFQVEGDPARAGLLAAPSDGSGRSGQGDAQISERLAEVSHFLLHTLRDGRLLEPAQARRALAPLSWRPDQPLTPLRAGEICSAARVSYLLAGSARFLRDGRIQLSASSFACRGSRAEPSVRETAADSRYFQESLRRLLLRATPFWQPRPGVRVGPAQPAVDLAVVLDHSGSMLGELPAILRGLRALGASLPRGSRLGFVTIGAKDRLDTVPFSTQWPEVLALAGTKAARGDVSVRGLAAALGIVQQYRDWKGRRTVLVFSDARIGRESSAIESHIRRLKSSGATVRLFSTQNQSYTDRVEWQRMARTLSLASPGVLYGREVGFVDQPGRFILMDGGRYFTSRRDLRSAILKGVVPRSVLEPLETIHFRREELNLNDLPAAFARRQGTRANYTGPVVSGLEAAISSVSGAAQSPAGTTGGTRVLVKNGGLSFWIRVHDHGILSQMRRSLGRKIYVGLHVAPAPGSGEKLVNLPAPVYIRSQGDVPQLLITTWADLIRRPDRSLVRTDTHFLLLEILEIDDGRSSQDIRR